MAVHKTSTTQGAWKGGIAFQHISREYDIPPEVMERGLIAIIEWIHEVKPLICVALGGFILSAMSKEIKKPPRSISEKSELYFTEYMFPFFFNKKSYQGYVENDSLEIILRDSERRLIVPTSVIGSIYKVNNKTKLLKYLDGTKVQCTLVTKPILFYKERNLFGKSEVLKIKSSRLHYIDGTKYREPPNLDKVVGAISKIT